MNYLAAFRFSTCRFFILTGLFPPRRYHIAPSSQELEYSECYTGNSAPDDENAEVKSNCTEVSEGGHEVPFDGITHVCSWYQRQ